MSTTADRFAEHLAARIGPGAAAPPDLLARVHAVLPRDAFSALMAPDSADGAAAVLASCSAEGWPVMPVGAATWLDPAAGTPTLPPVLLSTARLDRITEHEPADLVIGVQAGLPLQRLGAALAAKQQWLPLDPPAAPEATIGAIAANSSAGPLRAGHGTPRDMVLGIEIATGDGRLLRFGGRVVKNVAGYDAVRLAVGSRGSLGLITALYLRVRGAPRTDRTLAVPCGTGAAGARDAAALALAVRDASSCDAIEMLSPGVAQHIGLEPRGWHLLVRLLGSEAAVTEGLERCRRVVSSRTAAGIVNATELPSGVWTSLARLEAGAATAVRLTGPATDLGNAAGALYPDATGTEDGGLMAAHAADGVIRLWRPEGDRHEHAPAQAPGWGDIVASGSWTASYDRGHTAGPDSRIQQPDRPTVRILTERLRAVFDPAGIMHGRTGVQ